MSIELESESSPTAHLQQRSRSLCFPCFASRWERVRSASFSQSHDTIGSGNRWWSRPIRVLKKLREWSEIVAGPKWKTFIRRFNRHRSSKRMAKYQYDPLSYALNFDEGHGQSGDCDDDGFRNFSTRYAAVSIKQVSPEQVGDVAVLVWVRRVCYCALECAYCELESWRGVGYCLAKVKRVRMLPCGHFLFIWPFP